MDHKIDRKDAVRISVPPRRHEKSEAATHGMRVGELAASPAARQGCIGCSDDQ